MITILLYWVNFNNTKVFCQYFCIAIIFLLLPFLFNLVFLYLFKEEKMLGERILELRTAHNWTQVQLAQKLNVSKQAVSNWENNNILPSIEMLIKLSSIFSTTTDYLLALDDRDYIEVTGLTDVQLAHIKFIIDDLKNLK